MLWHKKVSLVISQQNDLCDRVVDPYYEALTPTHVNDDSLITPYRDVRSRRAMQAKYAIPNK